MPRTLEPNSPAKRLGHILKTYENQPWVIAETTSIIAVTIGIDRLEQWIDSDTTSDELLGKVVKFIRQHIPGQWIEELGYTQIIEHLFDLAVPYDALEDRYRLKISEPWTRQAARYLVELLSSTPKGQANHASEGIFLWVAQQISKLYRSRDERRIDNDQFLMLNEELHKKTNAIAAWAKAKRKDIGKVSLAEALEGANDFEVVRSTVQGDVVHGFDNGYTVQLLRTKDQLEDEGEVMQHCVGSYFDEVRDGGTVIFSLRDDKGRPHVTMEWHPDWDQILYDKDDPKTHGPGKLSMHKRHKLFGEMSVEKLMNSPLRFKGHFMQIMGKQNEPPLEKYQQYIRDFIRERFDGEPQGMLMAGADVKDLRLTNRMFTNVSFDHLNLVDTDWSGSTFSRAGFEQSNLTGAKFIDCRSISNPSAIGAGVTFAGSVLRNASFEGVQFMHVNFSGANMQDVIAKNAVLTDSDFRYTNLTNVVFDNSDLSRSIWLGESLKGSWGKGWESDPLLLDGASFKGAKGVPADILARARGVELENIDSDFT